MLRPEKKLKCAPEKPSVMHIFIYLTRIWTLAFRDRDLFADAQKLWTREMRGQCASRRGGGRRRSARSQISDAIERVFVVGLHLHEGSHLLLRVPHTAADATYQAEGQRQDSERKFEHSRWL